MNALFADVITAEAAQSVSQPTRRSAALLLHSLSEADRAWALSRLDPSERQALGPLLDELSELGVPRDPVWVRQVLGESAPAASARPDTARSPRERIAGAPAQVVASLLLKEPRGLVQRVLALGPWPWSEAVQATLRLHRGDLFEPSVAAPRQPGSTGTALDRAVLAQLAAGLDRLSPAPAALANGHPGPGVIQRFAKLISGRSR